MDNGSSDLLWSVFSDDSNSLTMRDKADISSLTQNFIDRLAVSSASRRMETSDALITCLNNAFSDYHMVVIKTIKLLAAQPSQYSNFVVDDSVVFLFEEPGFGECYSRMGISQFLKTGVLQ